MDRPLVDPQPVDRQALDPWAGDRHGDDSDAGLVHRARLGDDAAFAALYRRHRDGARWVAQRWCRSPHDIEDLVAQAFASVLAALPRLDPDEISFRSYLFACVRNRARDRIRRQRRDELCAEFSENGYAGPVDAGPMPGCAVALMDDALHTLPPRWQRVLWLTAVEDRSVSEVARQIGCPPATVAAIAYRARRRLRDAYLAAHPNDAGDDDCPACHIRRRSAPARPIDQPPPTGLVHCA